MCASFLISSLSALWYPQLGSTLGWRNQVLLSGDLKNHHFAGGKGEGGASGSLPSQRNRPPEPQPVPGSVPKSLGHPALQGLRTAATRARPGWAPTSANQDRLPQPPVSVPLREL